MAMTPTQRADFINRSRQGARNLIDAIDKLRALRKEYTSLDVGNELQDSDFPEWDITKAQFIALFTTLAAIETLGDTGHYTNLYSVK